MRTICSCKEVPLKENKFPPVSIWRQMVDSAFNWINDFPLDNSMGFDSSYPVNSNLLAGHHYLTFKKLRPGLHLCIL